MSKLHYGKDVFSEAIGRFKSLYEAGHRVVVSFSGGKDSGICLELAIIAAKETGHLPVEVVMRDEEIMFPGTFEYAERVYARKNEIDFHWLVANQPIINLFNRECPYWWTFDPLLKPEEWIRQPPPYAEFIKDLNIERMADTRRFPPAEGKALVHIIGLRTQESRRRTWVIASAKGFKTKEINNDLKAYPIYDWEDGDVWKAILDNKWDFNNAYNVMYRLGIPKNRLRIAPPTLAIGGVPLLRAMSRAYPQWYEKVCKRLPGVRAIVRFGTIAVKPIRRLGKTWEQCYQRTCIDDAPQWIRDRSIMAKSGLLSMHAHHSTTNLPEIETCPTCSTPGSWKALALAMYMGCPFSNLGNLSFLPYVEPEFFRKGSGFWQGKPAF